MIICPLCDKKVESLHPKSHLIPEWMYRNVYDSNNKMIFIDYQNEKTRKIQKGFYDQIICYKCEELSQLYDRYGSLILTNKSPMSPEYKSLKIKNDTFSVKEKQLSYSIWNGIDFIKFQKFIFICILRYHFYLDKSGNYLLKEKHFNNIKKLYWDNNFVDDSSYPIVMVKMKKDKFFFDYNTNLHRNKKGNNYTVEFIGRGYFFIVFISSHKIPEEFEELRLKSDGSLLVMEKSFKDVKLIRDDKKKIIDIIKQKTE